MEYIGTVQFFNKNAKRGNPIALYLEHMDDGAWRINVRLPQWHDLVGVGATPGKAAGDFEIKLKGAFPDPGAYDGPAWHGIKAEKPAPPKPAPPPAALKTDSSTEPKPEGGPSPTKSSVPSPPSPGAGAPGVPTDEGSTNPA